MEVHLQLFLIHATDGGARSTSRSILYPPLGKRPLYSLNKRLRGPQSPSGRFGEDKNVLVLLGFEQLIVNPVAQPWVGTPMVLPNGMRSVNKRRVCLAYSSEKKSHSRRCHAVKCKSLVTGVGAS